MAYKAKVYNRIQGEFEDITIDLELEYNVIMLYGDSGNGKTFLCEILRGFTDVYHIRVFDYRDSPKESMAEMKEFIKNVTGCLVVIDNADLLLLDKELCHLICVCDKNQYLVIGREPEGLHLRSHNFKDLKFEDNKFTLVDLY